MPIPKKLHYFWDGSPELPLLNRRCYDSWLQHLNDYELHHWHSNNLKIDSPYYQKALKRRAWAFASDYARLYTLYEHGGVYVDTDLEAVQPFDSLLDNEFFIGFESADSIAVGIFGASPGHPIIKEIMEILDRDYGHSRKLEPIPLPKIVTAVLTRRYGDLTKFFKTGFHDPDTAVWIYPIQCFYPYNPFDGERPMDRLMFSDIQSNTFAIHHWAFSWSQDFPLVSLKAWFYQTCRTGALKLLRPLKRALFGTTSKTTQPAPL